MAIELGTRTKQNFHNEQGPTRHLDRGYTRDVGMSKNVTGSFTYVNSATKQVQGIAGNFSAFAVNDPVLIEGTNLNNGVFTVTAIAGDGSTMTLDPSPQNEGPITSTVRTP